MRIIEFLRAFCQEREVLFFPFSSFCLENIKKGNFKGKNCIIINLEYLRKYKDTSDSIKKDENFKDNFINTFNKQNFSKEIFKSNIIPISNNYTNISSIDKKQVFKKIKNKINDKYNIEIKEDFPKEKEKSEENMEVIEDGENIFLQEKSLQEEDEKLIEKNLKNMIETNKKKQKVCLYILHLLNPKKWNIYGEVNLMKTIKKQEKGKNMI